MGNIDDSRCFASYTLFRKLYDSNVNDVYEIIRDFIKYTIFTESMREFDLFTLTATVNRVFAIKLIDAVIKRAIKKIQFEVKNGIYKCNPSDFSEIEQLQAEISSTNNQSNQIYEALLNYVEESSNAKLKSSEKEDLFKAFNSFMLGSSNLGKYSDWIPQFVIQCSKNPVFYEQFKQAKEGIVIYSGINYNAKTDNASKKWSEEITVFLDTEVIFHMAGYNGETYKQLFDDFFNLVNEINSDSIKKTQKKKIKLRYFENTQKEIDLFFQRAEDIVKGNATLISSVIAMKTITKGCKTPSDVAEKRVKLDDLLKTHEIQLDEKKDSYYEVEAYKYNIESQETIKKIINEINAKPKDVDNSLRSLSHIFVLRKGKIESIFERGKYVLVTDNYITKYIAWHDDIKSISGNVLCTDLYYFTDRLWCRLGKSFGLNESPKAYDVVSKAQVILSTRLNENISAQYDITLEKYNNKEISKEQALEVLSELRKRVMNPEDIQSESNVDAAMQAISVQGIDFYIQEKERKALEIETLRNDNVILNEKLKESNEEIQNQKKAYDKQLSDQRTKMTENIEQVRLEGEKEKLALIERIAKKNADKLFADKIRDYRIKRNEMLKKKICMIKKDLIYVMIKK